MAFSKNGFSEQRAVEPSHDREEKSTEITDTHDQSDFHGFATDIEHVPRGYFTSVYFLGTYIAHVFTFNGGLGGFNLVAPILTQIDESVGPSPNILWVAIVYPLGLAVGLGVMGRATDIFGRRWFMIIANFFGLVGAIICSRAKTVNVLIGGETLIGLGCTAAYSFNYVISEIVPMKYRFYALAGLFFLTLPMNGFNTFIATSFASQGKDGWRWCYYLLIILNGIATILYFSFYHPPTFEMKHKTISKMRALKEFDYIGATGLIAGVTLFLLGLNWGGELYPWKSPHVLGTILVGGVVILSLPAYEYYSGVKDPFIPLRLFKSRGWTISMLSSSIGATVYYSFSIIWPSMVQVVFAKGDETWAGYASCLVSMGIAVGEIIGGALTMTVTKQKYQCIIAMTIGTIFLGVTATCNVDEKGKTMVFVFLSCLFIGWNEAVTATLVGVCIKDQRDIGAAAGLSGCIRSLLGSVSAAIYSAVLRSRQAQTIPLGVGKAVIAAGLPSSSVAAFIEALEAGTSVAFDLVKGTSPNIIAVGSRAYQVANVEAYHTVFLSSLAFGGLCILLNIFIPNVDDLMTSDIAVTLHEINEKSVSNKVGDAPLHIEHLEHKEA